MGPERLRMRNRIRRGKSGSDVVRLPCTDQLKVGVEVCLTSAAIPDGVLISTAAIWTAV